MQQAELQNNFTYHPPKDGQLDKYQTLRSNGLALATQINRLVPESREKSLALTKIEEAIMWANAAIARNE